ncbi:MAG: hypothetical protein AAF371_16490 [Pseudomonadota bacterium]
MIRTVLVASALLAAIAVPAAAKSVDSRILEIRSAERVLVLADRTEMIVAEGVELSTLKSGDAVRVVAEVDEDGFEPATAVEIRR